jgi:hypothetical protein
MAEDFDYSLFGDLLVKPSTGESADPMTVLTDKVVSIVVVVVVVVVVVSPLIANYG